MKGTDRTLFNDIWNKSYINCGNEMKMKKWSSQWTQFTQLRKEAWKTKQNKTKQTKKKTYEPTIDLPPTSVASSSVGRASHRKSRGHGFKPRWSPEFFSGFFTQLHKLRSLRRSFLHFQDLIYLPSSNFPTVFIDITQFYFWLISLGLK